MVCRWWVLVNSGFCRRDSIAHLWPVGGHLISVMLCWVGDFEKASCPCLGMILRNQHWFSLQNWHGKGMKIMKKYYISFSNPIQKMSCSCNIFALTFPLIYIILRCSKPLSPLSTPWTFKIQGSLSQEDSLFWHPQTVHPLVGWMEIVCLWRDWWPQRSYIAIR